VELVVTVGNGVAELGVLGSRDAAARADVGHVIDDGIGIDVDAGRLATGDHLGELIACTAATLDEVTDRLVAGPPLRTRDVFLRR
jgi:hypothetical protein